VSVTSPIRWGKDGPNGNFDDMWLPVFGGEVIAAWERFNLFQDKVRTIVMPSGNEMKFPKTWRIGSEYHEVGVELLGLDMETKEVTITLDDRPLVSHFEIDDVDVAMSHFEVRSQIAKEAGMELARNFDKQSAILLLGAARTAASGSFPGGTNSVDRNTTGFGDLQTIGRAGAVATLNAIENWLIYREDNDIPNEEGNLFCAVYPGMWYALKNLGMPQTSTEVSNGLTPVFQHPDFNPRSNTIDQGGPINAPLLYNGVQIFRTSNLPGSVTNNTIVGSNITTGPTRYQGNFTTTAGVCWSPEAIGRLILMGIKTETERSVRRGSDFTVVKMLTGGGTLRPEVAYELKTA